eukprot:gene1123-19525_t
MEEATGEEGEEEWREQKRGIGRGKIQPWMPQAIQTWIGPRPCWREAGMRRREMQNCSELICVNTCHSLQAW